MQKKRRGRILRRVLWSLLIVLVLLVAGMIAWSQIGVLPAGERALQTVRENPAVVIDEDAPEGIVLSPAEGGSDTGLVFIPGGKVQPEAYAAVLQDLVADSGVTVVITRPWLNLAFFDLRGLDAFTSAADLDRWAVGGHSLGGVRACMLAEDADALVLFASYCATDLSASELPVLSLAGSEDGLSTPQKIDDARPLLPADAVMVEIDGASHASFGDYGPQAGDGTPTIERDEMRAVVTAELDGFLGALAGN